MSSDWSRYDTLDLVSENPLLSSEEIKDARQKLYNSFYSTLYLLQHSLRGMRGNFYNQIMARKALNHVIWGSKLSPVFSKVITGLPIQQ